MPHGIYCIALSLLLLAGIACNVGTATMPTEIQIEAGMVGFRPSTIEIPAGRAVRLVFTRTIDSVCLEQVQIPDLGIGPVTLPLNQPVVIEVTVPKAGAFQFTCGMGMTKGTLVVKR